MKKILFVILIIAIICIPVFNSFADASTEEMIEKYKQIFYSCTGWKCVSDVDRNIATTNMPSSISTNREKMDCYFLSSGDQIYLVIKTNRLFYGKIMFTDDGEHLFLLAEDGTAALYKKVQ